MTVKTKTIEASHQIKDEAKGLVTIQFAKYNVVDAHKDVHVPGAFEDGAKILMSAYGHKSWAGELPVGKGVIKDSKDGPTAEMQFFMSTKAGQETFATVKEVGDQQQWSYGYDTLKESFGEFGDGDDKQRVRYLEKQKVYEVSPVLLGAGGENTYTMDIKSAEQRGTLKMFDHCLEVLTSTKRLADRAEEIVALRVKDGKKGLGDDTETMLELLELQLKRLKELLTRDPKTADDQTIKEMEELLAISAWAVLDETE